ncbi:MAG: hypothetical protein Ct9H300mP14_05800 [Gammaproteobacteria bacterium]|nr:MAG: hypothetical protein Ct9H300mP14_05800 [Gammaproteobacteria bacterium]
MDLELTEEQRMLADSAQLLSLRNFCPTKTKSKNKVKYPQILGSRSLVKQSKWASMLPTCPNRLEAAA